MKIAILTQPLGHNYGGILQAFALQQVVKGLGHEVTTIDRRPDARSKVRRLLSFLKNISLKLAINKKDYRIERNRYDMVFQGLLDFIGRNICVSRPISSTKEMKRHFSESSYEAVIVGSDQTWRPSYSPNILNFYLDFMEGVPIARVAYASSFGVDFWEYNESQTLKCRELALKFDAISVREESGVKLCKEYLHVSAALVLDPTLLITAEDYLDKLNIGREKKQNNYLFSYILDGGPDKESTVVKVSEKLNLTPLSNQPAFNVFLGGGSRTNDYVYPKVEEWIKAIHEAEFVVTDSFHGCAFSILFNKPFLVIGNRARGMARFDSLLNMLGLEYRLVTSSAQVTTEIISCKIDWPRINAVLEEKRLHSLSFLKESIKAKSWNHHSARL